MEEIAVSAASKVAEGLVDRVGRACSYVIFYASYLRELKDEVANLDGARQRVQHLVDEAHNNTKQIEADVKKWATDAKSVADKVSDMLERYEKAKKTYFCGWVPNLKTRYHVVREARETVKAIQELIPKGQFNKVYHEDAPPGHVADAPDVNSSAGDGGKTMSKSQASILEDIMNALEDEKFKVIGVYGRGGVGKSTLLKEVEKKLRSEKRLFDVIAKATVSQTWELKNIQDDIAYALSLDLNNVPSKVGRADCLLKRLQMDLHSDPKKKILIILDDLWEKLDLEAVGIPSGDESKGCKLLITSRFKNVLDQEMDAEPTFRLEGFKNDEAFKLFEMMIGDKLIGDDELKAKAIQVVRKLAGLPLLITSIARTLKCSDVSTWDNMLIKVEDSHIEKIVKLSYDHLESKEAKSLFLLCGLIGGTVQVETLLGLGLGLGLFEPFNRTMKDARARLNAMLNSLRSICLLEDGDDDKKNVTIHDLYSEVVVSTPFGDQNSLIINSNYGSWPKEKLEKCWACLVNVGSDRLVELMRCGFPDVKILMMLKQHDMGDDNGLDFSHMKELRVLYFRSMRITSFPSLIEILGNLQSLYLDCCIVEDVAILGQLKALQILSFEGSKISRLPKEIGELTNLRLLNLSNCDSLEIIDPGVLKRLTNLEELHMKSFDQWMVEDEIASKSRNARLAELKSLTKIASLEISISDPTILLEDDDLPYENLIRFWINIGNAIGRTFEGLSTMKLKLEGCDSILSKEWVQKTLQKTQHLHLDGLRGFKKSTHELCIRGFSELKHLHIRNSPSIKYIASSFDDLPLSAFTKLESLFLENLINLEKICHGPIAIQCFSKLKVMSVKKCDRLKNLWCLSEMQRFVQLEEIELWECCSMQAIFTDDTGEDKVVADDLVELPNVRRLDLRELPNMTSFCSGAEITSEGALIQVSLPSLEKLKLDSVGSLILENCSKLLNIFPLTIIGRLHNLKEVHVFNCPFLESLFDCGSLDSNTEQKSVLLPKLEEVRVKEANRLRHVVKSDSQTVLGFPSLKQVEVEKCSKLRYLFPGNTATTLGKLKRLRIIKCEQMKEMVSKEEGGRSKAKVLSFPSLTDLSILQCQNFGAFIPSPTSVERPLGKTAKVKNESPQPLFNEMVTFPNIMNLKIEGVRCKELWNNQIPNDSFCNLEFLLLEHCDNLLHIVPSHMWKRLQRCLEILEVISCHSIEIIYEGDGTYTESGKLARLVLRDLDNLRHIWQSDGLPNVQFPSLKEVEVERCSELRYLFPNNLATTLGKLQRLWIIKCEQMKEVVPKEEDGRSKAKVMSFPSLIDLRILQSNNFGAFIPGPTSVKRPLGEKARVDDEPPQPLFNEMVTFPNIRKLKIEGVQCKELWNNQIPDDSFCNLEFLLLEHCDNLLRIAPSHMWKRLQRCLEILEVISCHSIEIIYEGDGIDMESGKLERLVLRDLDNLRHIWQSDGLPNVPFPNLRYVEALRCSHLEMLFANFTAKFLRQIMELVVESCEDMKLIAGHEECEEAIGTTIAFSELIHLRLFELPKFRGFLPEKYSPEFPSLQISSWASCGTEPDQTLGDWESYQQTREDDFLNDYEAVTACTIC